MRNAYRKISIYGFVIFSLLSGAAFASAQSAAQTREISFDELNDFVNDFGAHKAGGRFVVAGIPDFMIRKSEPADKFGNASYKNLFYLYPSDDHEQVANGFLTSAALVKNWNAKRKNDADGFLRVTAVLVESKGKFDVYRVSFVTKIEGLNADGSVAWTAAGAEPLKTKFAH